MEAGIRNEIDGSRMNLFPLLTYSSTCNLEKWKYVNNMSSASIIFSVLYSMGYGYAIMCNVYLYNYEATLEKVSLLLTRSI